MRCLSYVVFIFCHCPSSNYSSWQLLWYLQTFHLIHNEEYIPLVVNTSWSFPHPWLITWFELLTLPEHLISPLVFSGVCVTRSLDLHVCFVDRSLFFFYWPLCCLFYDVRILITPLVSSNSSYLPGILYFTWCKVYCQVYGILHRGQNLPLFWLLVEKCLDNHI